MENNFLELGQHFSHHLPNRKLKIKEKVRILLVTIPAYSLGSLCIPKVASDAGKF